MGIRGSFARALARARGITADSVTYRIGGDSITLDATEGASSAVILDANEIQTQIRLQDWLFTPADLEMDGVPVIPAPGHSIDKTIDGTTHRYEVIDLAGDPCFHFDAQRLTLFVHTKYAGAVS